MIKKFSLLALMAVSFMACKMKVETSSQEASGTAPEAGAATASAASVKDPVCGMERGSEKWTEFVVNGTDTSWFCSPHCKDQYVKNPDKYKKPEAPKS